MNKTDTFFVIHNFNTVPEKLLSYCENYIIYDASTEESVKQTLQKKGYHCKDVENTGHNITSYFDYFANQYDNLPEHICLCKGNMIGRHCSEEYFDRVYQNKYFTFLYEDKSILEKCRQQGMMSKEGDPVECLISESHYIENNTSWYVESPNHPHRYFDNYNNLLSFIYKSPVIPKYNVFSPGACYIIHKSQVQKHTPAFYRNLNKIMNYGLLPNFPSEAHHIERMLPVIFTECYLENEWMNDETLFDEKLREQLPYIAFSDSIQGKRLKKLRKLSYKLKKFI